MRILSLALICAASALAQPTLPNAVPMPTPEIQYLDRQGKPLSGSKLCSYAAGTNNALNTYTDSTAGTPNTNPVTLDVNGRASVWVGPQLYKFVLRTGGTAYPAMDACTTGTIQWTQDQVSDTTLYFSNAVKTAGTCTIITFQSTGTGSVSRTCSAKLADTISVQDFGAACNNSTDDTAAINLAIAAAALSGQTLVSPQGTCIHQPITITSPVTIALSGGSWKLKAGSTSDQITVAASHVSIYGPGTLDGNSANNPSGLSGVKGAVGANDLVFDGVTFLNHKTSNIRVESARNHIRHNIFNGMAGYAAVYFDNADPSGVRESDIIDNDFIAGIGADAATGNAIGIVASKGNIVARNRISGYSRMCVEAQQVSDKTQVLDNHCTISSANANANAFAISIGQAPNSIVNGNFIEFTGSVNTYGIEVVLSDYTIASGNIVINSYIPIAVTKSSHCIISSNIINGVNGTTQAGIVIAAGGAAVNQSKNIFNANRIQFTGAGRGIWQQCDNAGATCSDNEFLGNLIEGDGTGGSTGITLENDLGTTNHNSVIGNTIKSVAIGLLNGTGANNTVEIDGAWDTVPTTVSNLGTIVTGALSSAFTPVATGWYRIVSSTSDATVSGSLDIYGQYINTGSGALTKVSRMAVDLRISPFGASSMVTVRNLGVYNSNIGVIDQIEVSSDGAGHAWVDLHINAPSGAETAGIMTVNYSGQSIVASQVVAVPVSGATPGGSSVSLVNLGNLNAAAPPSLITTGPAIAAAVNYIGSETGANNAIVGALGGLTASEGQCVLVKLAHSLQIGANTFAINGGAAVSIKSHLNPANNIAAAYTAAGFFAGCYDATGPVWLDMAQ